MSKKARGLRIFHKLLLGMLVVAAIPMAGLLYDLTQAQMEWQDNVSLQLERTAGTLARQVDDWVDKNKRALEQAARLPAIESMDAERQKPVLVAMLETLDWTYLTFTTRADGKNVGRSDDKPPKFYGDRDYFKQVARGRPYGYQVLVGKTSGKPALVVSKRIESARGEMKGAIALAAHLTEVSKAVTDTRIGRTGFAILLDRRGKVIAHGDSEGLDTALQDLSRHPALARRALDKQIIFEEDGRRVVAHTTQTANDWTLIVQQDYDDAFATVIESKRYAGIVITVTLGLVLAGALFLGKRLVTPIEELTKVAGGFSRGELESKIPGTDRGDELGELARAVERMGVSISLAMSKLGSTRKAA